MTGSDNDVVRTANAIRLPLSSLPTASAPPTLAQWNPWEGNHE